MHIRHDSAAPAAAPISFDQFLAVDVRVGRVVAAEPFPEARKPAYRLTIDFGPSIGTRRSSAQLTEHRVPARADLPATRPTLVAWSMGGLVLTNDLQTYSDAEAARLVDVDGVIELKPAYENTDPDPGRSR